MDGKYLLSLQDFLAECVPPTLHRDCKTPANNSTQLAATISMLHTVLVENLLTNIDDTKQRLASEVRLGNMLVVCLEVFARILEDLQWKSVMSMEEVQIKIKAAGIFATLQQTLANNAEYIGE